MCIHALEPPVYILTQSDPVPAGVKNLLGGEQLTAVTLALDTIMEGRAPPENDPFVTFDPKVVQMKSSSSSISPLFFLSFFLAHSDSKPVPSLL